MCPVAGRDCARLRVVVDACRDFDARLIAPRAFATTFSLRAATRRARACTASAIHGVRASPLYNLHRQRCTSPLAGSHLPPTCHLTLLRAFPCNHAIVVARFILVVVRNVVSLRLCAAKRKRC
jgi:hypothetical protein